MKTTAHVVSLVSIFTLALACSSSTTPTPAPSHSAAGAAGSGTAGAGTAGAGTAGAGTAGAGTAGAGTAGAGTAGAGTAGAGTAGAGTAGAAACTAPTAALITDFSGTGGLVGGMPYKGGDPGESMAPTVTNTGSLIVTFGGTTTSTATQGYYQYVGLGLNSCTDASAYTGVTFTISGALTPSTCTIQFSAVDREHNTVMNGGTCMAASCYPGGNMFTLPATATPVMLDFTTQGLGGTDGTMPVDKTQLLSVQWQVNPPAGMECTGTVTIDDVMFH